MEATLSSSWVISCSTWGSMLFLPGRQLDPQDTGLLNSVSQFGSFFFPLLPLALPNFGELQQEAVQQQKLFLSGLGKYLAHLKYHQKHDDC